MSYDWKCTIDEAVEIYNEHEGGAVVKSTADGAELWIDGQLITSGDWEVKERILQINRELGLDLL
jgi:hypothetical protein